jgi:hypothetical protein
VPLPTVVAETLAAHISEFSPAEDGSLFTTTSGNLYRQEHFGARVFKPAAKSAGTARTGRGGPSTRRGRRVTAHRRPKALAVRCSPSQARVFDLWQVLDSNQRRLRRRFYRPLPLAARATCHAAWILILRRGETIPNSPH